MLPKMAMLASLLLRLALVWSSVTPQARARRRDARGDRTGRMRALTKAEDMYNLQ